MNEETNTMTEEEMPMPEPLIIADDKELTNAVADAAALQLSIHQAQTAMRKVVEEAKKKFEQLTRGPAAQLNAIFAGITTYCESNKDRLFPLKASAKGSSKAPVRQKTYAVLSHKLQYRSAEHVEVEDVPLCLGRIGLRCASIVNEAEELGEEAHATLAMLDSLQRNPPPELDKDAVLKHWTAHEELLRSLGIEVVEEETFKLAFVFSPGEGK